jgi:hypothetical protein
MSGGCSGYATWNKLHDGYDGNLMQNLKHQKSLWKMGGSAHVFWEYDDDVVGPYRYSLLCTCITNFCCIRRGSYTSGFS